MKKVDIKFRPTFAEEERLAAQGYRLIAGIDEAGRGALAGPVVAAAVILPFRFKSRWLKEVNDSKLLTPEKREYLFPLICNAAITNGVGIVSHQYIDQQDIVIATRLAMKQAIEQLMPPPDSLLIDFMRLPEIKIYQEGIVDGDALCLSIACASIIAKVTRDHLMIELDDAYPGYGLCHHKGYCTDEHVASLNRLGVCPIHRRSFHPVKDMLGL